MRRHEGVRNQRYKLIKFYGKDVKNGEEWEFYDLEKDHQELNNLYQNPEYAAQIEAMKVELDNLKAQYEVAVHDLRLVSIDLLNHTIRISKCAIDDPMPSPLCALT